MILHVVTALVVMEQSENIIYDSSEHDGQVPSLMVGFEGASCAWCKFTNSRGYSVVQGVHAHCADPIVMV